MDKDVKNQIVKSATAAVCVAALCVTSVTASSKISEAIKNTPVASGVSISDTQATNTDEIITDDVNTGSEDVTDTASTDDSAQNDTQSPDETPEADNSATNETAPSDTSGSKKPETTKSSVPSTKAEIINYCNTALNKVKTAKPGYTKTFVRKSEGNLPGLVAKVVSQNKKTTMKKGGDNTEDFPAAGFNWSSKLRESDVASATLKQNGQYYEIMLKLPNEKNPGKGESSKYGRVMSVITEADAKDMLSAVKTANFVYHDGYVYAKIDSKTGNVVKAEFSAAADISAELAVLGTLNASNIKSTESFSDFIW